MQPSPVQTQSIIYRRVHVEAQLDPNGEPDENLSAYGFDWNGVRLAATTGTSVMADKAQKSTEFVVSLKLDVQNQLGKQCPYKLGLELVGLFKVNPNLPEERRADLATVNGLAIVYGAARELVTTLTARMEYGPLVLPGVNFQDQVANAVATAATQPVAKTDAVKVKPERGKNASAST